MANFYDELYTLCGYEAEEINKERPRIEETLRRLELGPEDLKNAEDFVREKHDAELMGIRKILAVWLRELTDLVLAKDEGKKVIYFGFPSIGGIGMSVAAASEDVYCACPDVILCHTMGQIFNKLGPILEAGEENGLPAGHGLCTLQAIRVGALAKEMIPIPDLAFLSSYFCDMGSKTDDLLCERYGYPSIIVDGSMDSIWGEFPDFLPERVSFLGKELNKLFDELDRILGIRVTEEHFNKGMALTLGFVKSFAQLGALMNADPVPISMADVSLARYLTTGPTRRPMVEGPQAFEILVPEIQKRVDEGFGVVPKGAPRILLFFAGFSDPDLVHVMEQAGLAVSNQFLMAPLRMDSWESNQPTIGEQRADIELRVGEYHSNYGIIKRMAEMVEDLKVDGAIADYLFNCRPVASTSHLLKKFVEEETGVPILSLEVDVYDSRYYTPSSMRTKIETFAEILRARKAAKG